MVRLLLFTLSLAFLFSCAKNEIEIQYTILRDRVVVTEKVQMKKAFYIGVSLPTSIRNPNGYHVAARLLCSNKSLSESYTFSSGEKVLNMVFDLPYQIPDSLYNIEMSLYNSKGDVVLENTFKVRRDTLNNTAHSRRTATVDYEEIKIPVEKEYFTPEAQQKAQGYIVFSKSPLEYVYPGTRPRKTDVIDNISLIVCRNEFEPMAFSLYPLRDLGSVTVTVDDLVGDKTLIPKNNIEIAYLEQVEITLEPVSSKYQRVARLIKPGNSVQVYKNKCKRFWLTLKIKKDVEPGTYRSQIKITPKNGLAAVLPLTVTVVPITLEDIPGIDYCMLMTYDFTELTMPWSNWDRKKIYDSACKVLEDYKDHGMTTLCVHSPFIHITKKDGTTNMKDIFATLIAARDVGFKRPIILYMGHLIQTAKPKHPGNILGFDESVHIPRLKNVVKTVSEFAKQNNCPEVIFLPIDEADDSYQDPKGTRRDITPLLLQTIRSTGEKTMVTATDYEAFKPVDYICSSKLDKADLKKAHFSGAKYWMYNNRVTTNCPSPAYARYIYGYYTWANDIDGMSSWTFQNTQNAGGWPTKKDSFGSDIYLAYPFSDGPLSTLEWEAVREGIEDHMLLYKFQCQCNEVEIRGIDISGYVRKIDEIRNQVVFDGTVFAPDRIPYGKIRDAVIYQMINLNSI